jgi:hypothetical protein
MAEADPRKPGARRPNAALVATVSRWLAVGVALEVGLAAAVEALLLFTHRSGGFAVFAWPLGVGVTVGWLLVFAMLRAEESRLARELRTARTGTPVLRALVARRRQELPFLARWSSSKLGTAAVLLADGDRDGAVDVLRTTSVLLRGGRLDGLRAIVEADLERKTGTSAGLERCVQRLRSAAPVGNREADLYRVYVLVKAVLEQGDADTAVELADEFAASDDDEERVYATWLRVWFDLDESDGEDADPPSRDEHPTRTDGVDAGGDAARGGDEVSGAEQPARGRGDPAVEGAHPGGWPALSEGDLRMAMLAARSHGAESLVTKLTHRLSAIARPESRE